MSRKGVSQKGRATGTASILAGFKGRLSLAPWQVLALVLVGGFLLHMPALRAPFFADDFVFVDNVRSQSLLKTVISQDPLGNFFRPVSRQLYFWLGSRISSESPVFFHSVNMALFLACLGLLFLIAKRLGGLVAGAVAAAILAVHYAMDVPVLWASGSQDLLALAGALAAIHLLLLQRRVWAALVLFPALLCKETVATTPFVAVILLHAETRSWRTAFSRAVPLLVALVPWGVLWMSFGSTMVAPGVEVELSAGSLAAACVQLARVTLGLEWPTGSFGSHWAVSPPVLALLPILVAVLGVRRQSVAGTGPSLTAGLTWGLLGALPVAFVTALWSAYYFLFAVAGVALALGTWTARLPRWVAVTVVVVFAWTSQGARVVNEFATGPGAWTAQSHMNTWWFKRGASITKSYLEDLRRAHPSVPGGSTFFFFEIPGFTIWHSGPVVRWAYHDDSLHGYFLREFSLDKARQRTLFFFGGKGGRLVETSQNEALSGMAMGAILEDNLQLAHDILSFQTEQGSTGPSTKYCLAFVNWARGDTTSAVSQLKQLGVPLRRGPTPELLEAQSLARSNESDRAIRLVLEGIDRNGLDPDAHGLLADLILASGNYDPSALIAAFISHTLDPDNPRVWRRWGMIQYHFEIYPEAKKSLERYLSLGGDSARGDKETREVLDRIQGLLEGSERLPVDVSSDIISLR